MSACEFGKAARSATLPKRSNGLLTAGEAELCEPAAGLDVTRWAVRDGELTSSGDARREGQKRWTRHRRHHRPSSQTRPGGRTISARGAPTPSPVVRNVQTIGDPATRSPAPDRKCAPSGRAIASAAAFVSEASASSGHTSCGFAGVGRVVHVGALNAVDPDMFMFLTFLVSLQAIFLTSSASISQNHLQAQWNRRVALHSRSFVPAERETTSVLRHGLRHRRAPGAGQPGGRCRAQRAWSRRRTWRLLQKLWKNMRQLLSRRLKSLDLKELRSETACATCQTGDHVSHLRTPESSGEA